MNSQVNADMAAFSAPPPEVAEAARKEKEKRAKNDAAASKALKPEQLKAAEKLNEHMKAEREAGEKSALLQRIADYVKLVREYHPERFEMLSNKIKTASVKNSCEELRVWIKDIENDLGKSAALDMVKRLWIEGSKVFEMVNANGRFGLHVENLGVAAANSVTSRQLPDGSILVGPAVPTLAEFACKHSNWFSQSVDTRMIILFAELVAAVHKVNSEGILAAKAHPVSKETKEKMKDL